MRVNKRPNGVSVCVPMTEKRNRRKRVQNEAIPVQYVTEVALKYPPSMVTTATAVNRSHGGLRGVLDVSVPEKTSKDSIMSAEDLQNLDDKYYRQIVTRLQSSLSK